MKRKKTSFYAAVILSAAFVVFAGFVPTAGRSESAGRIAGQMNLRIAAADEQNMQLVSAEGVAKMKQTAFAYGDLSNIGNRNDPAYAARTLGQFPFVVCTPPGKLSPPERFATEAAKSGGTRFFGYVNIGRDGDGEALEKLDDVKKEIDQIADAGWYGVFIDQFGYDFGETRERQNEIIDYIHTKKLSCFVNAWDVDDALGDQANQANPGGKPPHLKPGDWYLCESFYRDSQDYRCGAEMMEKYLKAAEYREKLGISIAALSYRARNKDWSASRQDIEDSYMLARSLGFEGWWFGEDDLNAADFGYGNADNADIGSKFYQHLRRTDANHYRAVTDRRVIEVTVQGEDDAPLISIRHFDISDWRAMIRSMKDRLIGKLKPAARTSTPMLRTADGKAGNGNKA